MGGKSLLMARSNLRKAKGQTAAIIVLVLLAAAMMNLWLMLASDYKQNYDRCHDRLNDGHVNMAAYTSGGEFGEFVSGWLDKRDDVEEYSIDETYGWVGSFNYNGGEVNTNLIFMEKDTALSRKVGKVEITEDSGYSEGIYLPVLYGKGGYKCGDEIELSMGSEKLKYTVCGFLNSASAGSHNCGMCVMLLTEDKYNELEKSGIVPEMSLISVRIADKTDSEAVESAFNDAVTEKYPNINKVSNTYTMTASSRYISQSICVSILSALAFLIILIAVVVIASNVMNYINEYIKNLGAMKAVGYKSGQLISVLIVQFAGLALVTAIAGIALSYGIFPSLNEMMIAQTGIPYSAAFLPIPCIITILITAGAAAAAVYFSAKRIRKIEPITALRQGIQTHSFKKNHLPLDNTKMRMPLNSALALKTALSGMKQNVTVGITMLVLSLVIVFSGVMLENFIVDKQKFVDIIVGESADSCINVNSDSVEKLIKAFEGDSRVLNHYMYTSDYVSHTDEVKLIVDICDDFSKVGNQNTVVEGRFPKYDNETAVAIKYAKENKLKIGQEISLSSGGKTEKYIISGYTQITNNLGKDCLLTAEGFERISELTNVSYYFNVTGGTDIDKLNKELTEPFTADVNSMANIKATIEGSSKVYISLMTAIVIAVLILSGVIVIFVLYLLVRTLIGSKKRDYGIMKALGFTSGQLILQTALSFMPPIIISVIFGITLSTFVINPLLAVFMSGIGIVKCTFSVPLYFNIAAGLGLTAFAFGAACLLSGRVKRITPIELIAE